ncbi:DUF2189 domain-containing protein [Rhodoblastus sp.]|uniref:DUF2189 domain-containing protein n=1 Tax=Rhodoblastus sp. TaxID=1962975 RepID=UPI003F9B933C
MQDSVQPAEAGVAPRVRRAVVIRKLQIGEIPKALGAGWNDFRTAPGYGLVVGGAHVAVGWLIILLVRLSGFHSLAYPLLTGVALVTPFSAAALYEVSRRLEKGEKLSWGAVLRSVRDSGGRDLGWMCLVSLFAFIIWVDFATFLYLMFYGLDMPDPTAFVQQALTTSKGIAFILTGNFFGGLIAFAIFSLTVVSYPLLLDRDVDFATAMISSVKAVRTNPLPMLAWAAVIAVLLALGLMTALLGLTIVLPLLGHATWHVYRAVVEPEPPPGGGA